MAERFIQQRLLERYIQLWNNFKNKPFTLAEAENILKENKKGLTVTFVRLEKAKVMKAIKATNPYKYRLTEPTRFFQEFISKIK